MTEAKRRIKKFDFSGEGAHVSLVDAGANALDVLIMKAAKVQVNLMDFLQDSLYLSETEAEMIAGMMGITADNLYEDEEYAEFWKDQIEHNLNRAVLVKSKDGEKIAEKLDAIMSKGSQPTLESTSEETVSSSEDAEVVPDEDNQPVNKEVNTMSDKEMNYEEQLQKAAEKIAADQVAAVEKKYADQMDKYSKEVELLKAADELRTKQEYVAKAEAVAAHIGDSADVEGLAKALRKAEKDEEMSSLLKAVEELTKSAGKEELLEEVGKSATQEQELDKEARIEALAKSKREANPSLAEFEAYIAAADELR